jgi:hypothetical protein
MPSSNGHGVAVAKQTENNVPCHELQSADRSEIVHQSLWRNRPIILNLVKKLLQ